MTQQTAFGAEVSRWPDTRQNWAITTPPGPGAQNMSPSAPPSGWQPRNSTSLPGLEYLIHLDKLFVDQHIDTMEVITGWPAKNKYVVMDDAGRQIFYLKEDSSLFNRLCCGSYRGFTISVIDRSNREVLRLQRATDWCLSHLEVYAGDIYLGKINEKFSWLYPEFDIHDDRGNVVFQISGALCSCKCFGPEDYKVYSADASRQVGLISKQWSGLMREIFTNADVFGISFPMSIDVKLKALLLAAAILIDFVRYEEIPS